ncbi:hypothetical protein D3C75_863600 [compost metagenome]
MARRWLPNRFGTRRFSRYTRPISTPWITSGRHSTERALRACNCWRKASGQSLWASLSTRGFLVRMVALMIDSGAWVMNFWQSSMLTCSPASSM